MPYEELYFHGIDLTEWYPCRALALSGKLFSPDVIAEGTPGLQGHRSLRDTSMEDLASVTRLPPGVYSPRAVHQIALANVIRNGGHAGVGELLTAMFSPEKEHQILQTGNSELEFERIRRRVAPEATSRLSCLWVAPHTEEGKTDILKMCKSDSTYIFPIKITYAKRITKADPTWFEKYGEEPKLEYIEKYWGGVLYDKSKPRWEYLIEGTLEINDIKDYLHIRDNGAHLELLDDLAILKPLANFRGTKWEE